MSNKAQNMVTLYGGGQRTGALNVEGREAYLKRALEAIRDLNSPMSIQEWDRKHQEEFPVKGSSRKKLHTQIAEMALAKVG